MPGLRRVIAVVLERRCQEPFSVSEKVPDTFFHGHHLLFLSGVHSKANAEPGVGPCAIAAETAGGPGIKRPRDPRPPSPGQTVLIAAHYMALEFLSCRPIRAFGIWH